MRYDAPVRVVAVLMVVLAARSVRADDAADRHAKAEDLAKAALLRIQDRNDYAGASVMFEEAYDLTHELPYLLNVAVTRRKGNLPQQAVAAYRRYLGDGGAAIPEGLRDQVLADIAAITHDAVQVTVRTTGSPADITLDGVPVGVASNATPLLVLVNGEAGRAHTIQALRAGQLPAERALGELHPGQVVEVTLEPRPKTGQITIDSEPPAAQLTLSTSGRDLGPAPQIVELPPGDYEVSGRLRRYDPGRERVHVIAGEPQHVTIHLAKTPRSWWERHHTAVYLGGSIVVAAAGVLVLRELFKPTYDGQVIVYPGN